MCKKDRKKRQKTVVVGVLDLRDRETETGKQKNENQPKQLESYKRGQKCRGKTQKKYAGKR